MKETVPIADQIRRSVSGPAWSGPALLEALERAALAYPDSKLDQPLKKGATSAYVQLHGATQHNLWHGGQIVALKRALKLPAVVPPA